MLKGYNDVTTFDRCRIKANSWKKKHAPKGKTWLLKTGVLMAKMLSLKFLFWSQSLIPERYYSSELPLFCASWSIHDVIGM